MDKIDLTGIVRRRFDSRWGRMIPDFFLRWLERIIHQDELNAMLAFAFPHRGHAFSERILSHLGITTEVRGLEDIPFDRPLIFASNHPLGGLDGIALVAILGRAVGDDNFRVLVNDMLMHVEPLRDVFLPINKFGRQGRDNALLQTEALRQGKHIVMFPAGLVSRLHDDGTIHDLQWQKHFISKALEYDREIVPIRFEALNRPRFYKLARWRKRLGIKVNIEQILLPGELCRPATKRFVITFGQPQNPKVLKENGMSIPEIAEHFRKIANFLFLKQ